MSGLCVTVFSGKSGAEIMRVLFLFFGKRNCASDINAKTYPLFLQSLFQGQWQFFRASPEVLPLLGRLWYDCEVVIQQKRDLKIFREGRTWNTALFRHCGLRGCLEWVCGQAGLITPHTDWPWGLSNVLCSCIFLYCISALTRLKCKTLPVTHQRQFTFHLTATFQLK